MLLSRSLCNLKKKNIIRKSTNIHVSFSCSNIYYINDNLDKRTWTYIFGACCATTVFIPSFHNYRIWSFLGLLMTTFTAWYLTIASLTHGQVLYFFYNLCWSQKSAKKTNIRSSSIHDFFFFLSLLTFSLQNFKVEGVKHSGPTKMILYFTGATNILYTFGGHAVTV